MARIWITGAHGFIGRNLARYLYVKGHQVGGLGHGTWPDTDAACWGVHAWINGDVVPANLGLLQRGFGMPDIIFHLAGGASVGAAVLNPREDFFRTVVSTAELLDWVRQQAPSAALVAVSSAAVYGAGHQGPIAETTGLNPYSPYGHHKRMMEELCHSYARGYGLRMVVARLFSVYGPGLRKQLLWDLCTQLAAAPAEVRLGGTGRELRDWTHVDDVVRALVEITGLASTDLPVLNVGTGVGTSVEDIARQVIAQWDDEMDPVPALRFSGQSRPGDPFSLVAATESLAQLGFECQRDLRQGLTDYVCWYRQRSQGRD